MSAIPDDIWTTAAAIAKLAHIDGPDPEPIANAILAERQRCADVAEGFRQTHDTGNGFDSQPARATAEAIRNTILAA